MLSKWPIRNKLLLGIGLLLLIVATLSASGFYGLYAYRSLVKSLSGRSSELPLAAELSGQVSDLRITLSGVRSWQELPAIATGSVPVDSQLLRERFRMNLDAIDDTLDRYQDRLDQNIHRSDSRIDDDRLERETLARLRASLARINQLNQDRDWILDGITTGELAAEVEQLHHLATELPSHLRRRLAALGDEVRLQYRTAIVLNWTATIAAGITFLVLVRLFYVWIFRPLRLLIAGSRQIAGGRFTHRILLTTHDEMSELAEAMNEMTDRFQAIREDLDRQVRERTKQVVRSERLASVGFLAAGVAHEINNPLASIAFCAESLEGRVLAALEGRIEEPEVIRNYLRMIQNEAFRCKEITEKLLDFSRMGDVERQRTDLGELVEGVIEMVGHVGRYQNKQVELLPGEPVFAQLNAQEMKQVALNLITNGLDSVEPGGKVTVEVRRTGDEAEMIVSDNGCGMTDEVLEHLFEPFFTRRRGGEGTGLGLSIAYRIIADHEGHIEATSAGRGLGSRFVVTLPICHKHKLEEKKNRYQAA